MELKKITKLFFSESLEKNLIREGWRIVKSNPHDFEGWTRLLKLVEKVVR